jgi:hypothetical protein
MKRAEYPAPFLMKKWDKWMEAVEVMWGKIPG